MEFKGFHARSSEEAKSAPVARNSQVGAEDPWEIGCIAGPEVNSLYPEAAQCGVSKIDWAIVFPIAAWSLWLHRNSVVFGKPNICKDLKAETLAKAAEMAYLGITENIYVAGHWMGFSCPSWSGCPAVGVDSPATQIKPEKEMKCFFFEDKSKNKRIKFGPRAE
ncbi:hypothetical protein CFP56_019512 [Quercus suber]|uniref:Uncharacterized protein n=1 Tax=Quercus suber TaxID=58331 RepID=A0AAW0KH14_QUESU